MAFWPSRGVPETWHFYWLGVGCAGIILLAAPDTWQWFRQEARNEGAFFFLHVSTVRNEWQPKHVVLIGAFGATAFALDTMTSDGWLSWVAFTALLALSNSLRTLPIHFGRRPPNAPRPQLET